MKKYLCKCGGKLTLRRIDGDKTIVAQHKRYQFICSNCSEIYIAFLNESMERYPAGYDYIKDEWS